MIGLMFRLGADALRAGAYVKPVSYNPATGVLTLLEQTAPVNALAADFSPYEVAAYGGQFGDQRLLVKVSELGTLEPTSGDYFLETATAARWDITAAKLSFAGKLWVLQATRQRGEDWGDLTPALLAEDWADLTPQTTAEDRGPLS